MSKRPKFEKPDVSMIKNEKFKVKTSQIPPMDVAFSQITLTDYELLVATIRKLNELILMTNSYTEFIEEILSWVVGDGVELAVKDKLEEWLENGTLENLINETLFNKKLDKTEFEDFIANTYNAFVSTTNNNFAQIEGDMVDFKQEINNIVSELVSNQNDFMEEVKEEQTNFENELQSDLDAELSLYGKRIDVLEKLTVLDTSCITNDNATECIQQAIDELEVGETLLIPNGEYKVNTLKINTDLIKISGMGGRSTKLIALDDVMFDVNAESNLFTDLFLFGHAGLIYFNDVRVKRANDFDIFVLDCFVQNGRFVVNSRGRGAMIQRNTFSNISEAILNLTVLDKGQIIHDGSITQEWENAYRGYFITDNRVHHGNGALFKNDGDNMTIVQNINLSNNSIEGRMGIMRGYGRNITALGNHVWANSGGVASVLFSHFGCQGAKIDVSVGYFGETENHEAQFLDSIMVASNYVGGLDVNFNIDGSNTSLFTFLSGGNDILLKGNAKGVAKNGNPLIQFNGTKIYKGVAISGNFNSVESEFVIREQSSGLVQYYDVSALNKVNISKYHNFNSGVLTEQNKIVTGLVGMAGSTTNIEIGYRPRTVTVFSPDGKTHYKTIYSSGGSPNVTIIENGFNLKGELMVTGHYMYIVK